MSNVADTPEAMIDRLDAAISRRGQTVVLTKGESTKSVMASVRPVKADEIIGTVTQTHSKVILSPTGLSSILPLTKGDKCKIAGRQREIAFYAPFYVNDTLVRIELTVAG